MLPRRTADQTATSEFSMQNVYGYREFRERRLIGPPAGHGTGLIPRNSGQNSISPCYETVDRIEHFTIREIDVYLLLRYWSMRILGEGFA